MALANFKDIAKAIIDHLFLPEDRRLNQWIDQIIDKHRQLVPGIGFSYGGEWFGLRGWQVPPRSERKGLHPSLWDEMGRFLWDRREIETDKDLIRQGMFALLSPCQTDQDIRDALPEILVTIIPGYAALPRVKAPAWTIASNDRAMRNFQQAFLPKVQFYVTARMLY